VQESGVEWSLNMSLHEHIHSSSKKPPGYQPGGISRHPQGAMTCDATCPFTGYWAKSALMGDGGTGLFLSSDPQTQHCPPQPSLCVLSSRTYHFWN
jgi:hypothetical protein